MSVIDDLGGAEAAETDRMRYYEGYNPLDRKARAAFDALVGTTKKEGPPVLVARFVGLAKALGDLSAYQDRPSPEGYVHPDLNAFARLERAYHHPGILDEFGPVPVPIDFKLAVELILEARRGRDHIRAALSRLLPDREEAFRCAFTWLHYLRDRLLQTWDLQSTAGPPTAATSRDRDVVAAIMRQSLKPDPEAKRRGRPGKPKGPARERRKPTDQEDVGETLVFAEGCVLYLDREVPLTGKRWEVAHAIWSARGHRMRVSEIIKVVWPDGVVDGGTVRSHVYIIRKALRKLLRRKGFDPIPNVDSGEKNTAYRIQLA